MQKMKLTYESPQITATKVELESSICAGSVEFGGKKEKIDIESQEVATVENNDFSGAAWVVDENNN